MTRSNFIVYGQKLAPCPPISGHDTEGFPKSGHIYCVECLLSVLHATVMLLFSLFIHSKRLIIRVTVWLALLHLLPEDPQTATSARAVLNHTFDITIRLTHNLT